MQNPYSDHLSLLAVKAAVKAGEKVLQIYNGEYTTTFKADESPLTTADIRAHECIVEHLAETGFPVLSEEGRNIPWETRRMWHYYWLVDPLDGTKEFVNRNGEFTVNIALIANHKPVIGVVYVPVSGMLYVGNEENGSWSLDCFKHPVDQDATALASLLEDGKKLPLKKAQKTVTILASRSHLTPETSKIIERIKAEFAGSKIINAGSSLKFCRLAEGSAQYYPRFSPTMEWDTAAGHAVAANSGIVVNAWPEMSPLQYNTKESLLNSWFFAFKEGMPDFAE